MKEAEQTLRFAVGSADGPRSRTWRLWVHPHKSDVYISGRSLGSSVKVSLHEPGPARFALTSEWVRKTGYRAPGKMDRRLAVEWERPRSRQPRQIARTFSIIVPFDEVLDREAPETGTVTWVPPPPDGTCIHFDVVYVPAGALVTGHPGARSMSTGLVGVVLLNNGERVYVTWLIRPLEDPLRRHIVKLRTVRIIDKDENPIKKAGMLSFGTEPNPDRSDGTHIGMLLDVTLKGT